MCVFFDHKNEDIWKSVSSFETGPIFVPRVGQDLSRNRGLVSVYAFQRISLVSTDFFITLKSRDFHEFSSFLQNYRGATRRLLGHVGCLEDHERAS